MQESKEKVYADFESIYLNYFSKMKYFAKVYVLSEEDAENIVQDVFAELWEKKVVLGMSLHLVSYLFKATKNRCLNFLRHQAIVLESANELQLASQLAYEMNINSLEMFDLNDVSESEITAKVERALNALPEKCREIFVMNKLEGKKQKEIASILNISVHTVENQIAIAYKKLRNELHYYYPLLVFLFSN